MKKLILAALILGSQSAFSTIWITASDPRTNKIAVVGTSSGHIGNEDTMVTVDNKGIAVVGSWYLFGFDRNVLESFLKDEARTAHEVVKDFSFYINQDEYKRRVSMVNARFENASEPGRGCHENNAYCGKYEDQNFSITGGGLVGEKVILAAKDALLDPAVQAQPIECQLYKGIEAIIKSGGEYKLLERLSFIVDDITKNGDNKTHLYYRKDGGRGGRSHENTMLTRMNNDLKKMGFNCQ